MPAKRSDQQLKALADFIHGLYVLGGFATWAELADEAGVHNVSLSGWKNAQKGLDGLNLLRLIQATAKRANIAPDTLAVVLQQLGDKAEEASRDELLLRLDEVAGLVAEGFARLAVGASPLEQRPSDEASPNP